MPRAIPENPITGADVSPGSVGRGLALYQPGHGKDLGPQLEKLSNVLDPYGTGPMAQMLNAQREAAARVAEREFLSDANITEAEVIQRNPSLRGATNIVARHLDSLRGERGAIKAEQLARLKYSELGLKGKPPEVIAGVLDEIEAKAREVGAYGDDGSSSFGREWARRRQAIESGALDEHIEAINQQHLADSNQTARFVLQSRASKNDWDGLGVEFTERIVAEEALGITREQSIKGWIDAADEIAADSPVAGGAPYKELLAAKEFDVAEFEASGRVVEVNTIRDPSVRSALARAARAADAAVQTRSEDKARADKLLREEQLLKFGSSIAEDVQKGTPKDQLRGKYTQALSELDPLNHFAALKMIDQASRVRGRYGIGQEEYTKRLRAVQVGEYKASDIGEWYDLSDEQYKGLIAASEFYRKGEGVVRTSTYQNVMRDMTALEQKAVPGLSKPNTPRNDFIRDQKAELHRDLLRIVGEDPTLLDDPARFSATVDNLFKLYRDNINERYPRRGQSSDESRRETPDEAQQRDAGFSEMREFFIERTIMAPKDEVRQEAKELGIIEDVNPYAEKAWGANVESYLDIFDAHAKANAEAQAKEAQRPTEQPER